MVRVAPAGRTIAVLEGGVCLWLVGWKKALADKAVSDGSEGVPAHAAHALQHARELSAWPRVRVGRLLIVGLAGDRVEGSTSQALGWPIPAADPPPHGSSLPRNHNGRIRGGYKKRQRPF